MKKRSRKIIAIVCALALVIGSFATYSAQTKADVDPSTLTPYTTFQNNPSIAYYMITSTIDGFSGTPSLQEVAGAYWLHTAFAAYGDVPTVEINGEPTTDSSIIKARSNALVQIDTGALQDNAYTHIVITKTGQGAGVIDMYIRMGSPTSSTIDTDGGWLCRNSSGDFEAGAGYTYNHEGICSIFAGHYDPPVCTADITVTQPLIPDSVTVNVTSTTQNDQYLTQVAYKKTGLNSSKEYVITLKADSTILDQCTVSAVTSYQKCVGTGWSLSAGRHVLTLDVEEVQEPPVVEDITITPNTEKISELHNIWANWTNPTGSTKSYVYLGQADDAHAAATLNNGWIFNYQAPQPIVAVDNVAQTRDASIIVEAGETYTLVVESYNSANQQTGYGELEITIPELTPEEEELQEYLAKINTSDNLAYQKTAIVGSNQGTKQNITDGNNTTRWQADKTIDNTYFAVDLGEVCTVEKVLVSWEGSNATSYAIYTAGADGVYAGSPIATITGLPNNTAQAKLTTNLHTNARYVKIVVTGWSDNALDYGISPYELAVFGQAGALDREINFTNSWRQTAEVGVNTYYGVNATWSAAKNASYYKTYINAEDDDHKAKGADGTIWSDANSGKGSSALSVSDVVGMKKTNSYLADNMSYTLIVVAYDSEENEVARGQITLDEKPSLSDLDYTSINNVLVHGQSAALPCSYAIYDAESSYDMREEAAQWGTRPFIYGDNHEFAQVTWGDLSRLFPSPDIVTINGTNYTSKSGPIENYADTLVQIQANASGGFDVGYNKVKITKGDNFVTVVFRVGGATAPTGVTATEQSGVPGSIRVNWVPGPGTPAEQVYRIYVDGDMKRGNLTGTSAIVNNIDAGSHTVKVVGFYEGAESQGTTASVSVSRGVKYSSDISIEGFQIRSNYEGTPPTEVSFRTMCKAPKRTSSIKVDGKTYTIREVGTIYAKDTNTRDKQGTNVLDASYTLLDETVVPGEHQYTYKGMRQYDSEDVTFGYVAGADAFVEDYKSGDKDNEYYAFTMNNMDENLANTLWVRPFVVASDGTIIYGKSTAYTSVAEIANTLYENSMSKNETGHEYLFNRILHDESIDSEHANSPFYRDNEHKIQYGWNGNLYIGFRKVPDSWNGKQTDEGQYVRVGDWRIHNSSHYNELTGNTAAASYKGNSNDEMMVRVDNPGEERDTDGDFPWNWGIQMKLANTDAYSRLEDGRRYKMTITYNSTKAGMMRIKTEGNSASLIDDGYYTDGHDIVYDFDAVAGGNAHSITFTYDKNKYVNNPGADPSIVLCLGAFKVYPFTTSSATRPHDSRSQLCIDYYDVNNYKPDNQKQHQPGDIGGFPAGTIISDVDIQFTEVD